MEFITARESGFEGIACVDDVARAALLALSTYEHTGAESALRQARDWLRFVEYMQGSDGRFTNFIVDEAGAKNMRGQTSRTGGLWWTGRAMWALAAAYRVTGDERYRRRFLRGRLAPTSDMKIKALHALALMELYQAAPDEALMRRITALCDAIVASGPATSATSWARGRSLCGAITNCRPWPGPGVSSRGSTISPPARRP